ncbi:MAG TPA: DUF456 domain-containing protein [Gordonia sp. (in: high G+C Gram-positive bacteria)]|uniref:DUF456 domain-containing protein n=1 Tax=unclassified Gordonia (in: high G+C Gram-positive bacteria) TaxID=2657482 RepID=UPI000FA0F126|nr:MULTISPECIES: DUF456 domain-containing protein [unclassified Gordonia (in: high G+C Gram-positive bacteria)]RUP41202.1 MAG: DUF456 domain-containing protein [Gordonia sp. (in: high G+C Gram-positive bacteria)]HNP55603.1 DUF456 domain-containing protein [Gordonia sp. (in: high G+C Gram-positive bacteria)]HRC50504.1 DUF456 domain-containing protein [Gordonia sp. (in: high G+C Gram-positive bacteria)]
MPFWGELLIGLVIAIGLLGIVFPVLPGGIIVGLAIGVWAFVVGGWAWAFLAAAAVVIAAAEVIKYYVAGRTLKSAGVPNVTVVVGGIVGIIGFFVVPVVGLILGFILGAMVSELVRGWSFEQAWRGAVAAMKAAGASMLVELSGALIATTIWLFGAFVF